MTKLTSIRPDRAKCRAMFSSTMSAKRPESSTRSAMVSSIVWRHVAVTSASLSASCFSSRVMDDGNSCRDIRSS